MYTLPPHYALKCYSQNKPKTHDKPILTKSLSAILSISTPRKKKKTKKDIFDIYQQKLHILKEIKAQLLHYEHSTKRNLLFISNESHSGYQRIKQFLDNDRHDQVLLIPFGHDDWEAHAKYMEQKLWEIGKKCVSIHTKRNMFKLIGQCDAIMICGGNAYKLLYYLYQYNLMQILQRVINDGLSYIGIGCGVSAACLTVQTCLDVPAIQPPTFKALSVIPFQLIPRFDDFSGDVYDEQIRLFMKESKDHRVAVLGLCKECYLLIRNNRIRLQGTGDGAVLYRDSVSAKERVGVGGLLSSLLHK